MTDRIPVDRDPGVGAPAILLISVAVVTFLTCVTSFAVGWVSTGTWAGIAALLSSAAGLAWLTSEGRRQRGNQPLIGPGRPG